MATISLSLSAKSDKSTGKSEILIRFVVGSRINQRGKSNVFINGEHWNAKEQRIVVPKFRLMNEEQQQLVSELQTAKTQLENLVQNIQQSFIDAGAGKKELSKDWLKLTINNYYFPQPTEEELEAAEETATPDFFGLFDEYIENAKISDVRKRNYKVVVKVLKRYELYKNTTLTFDTLTTDTLRDFDKFLREEHTIYDEAVEAVNKAKENGKKIGKTYLDIIAAVSGSKKPEARGDNAISAIMKKFRAFIRWANGLDKDFIVEPYTDNNPFDKYSIVSEQYGTPYYLTIEERNKISEAEMPNERLAKQRDIFVFQCLIGCRISDLWAMKKDNVINGAIEYIPRKTKDERPIRVRVPLNDKAREILERYQDDDSEELLPFVAQQQYNEDLKAIFKAAGIERMVTILNPLTKEEEKKPIYEVACSHMARRTFVGNLYKKVKDPNLIGKLSGHAENSRAFVRYRDIDEEMARELVDMLD